MIYIFYLLLARIYRKNVTPTTKSDYERPISISFGQDSSIISEGVLDKKPENLNITYKITNEKIIFDPILLNKKDEFGIGLLVKDFQGQVKPTCRIIGVKEIKFQTNKSKKPNDEFWLYLVVIIFSTVTNYLLVNELYVLFAIVTIFTFILLNGIRYFINRRLEKLRKSN